MAWKARETVIAIYGHPTFMATIPMTSTGSNGGMKTIGQLIVLYPILLGNSYVTMVLAI